jgi:surface antigen
VALGLHGAAHDAEGGPVVAVQADQAGDEGVERSLAGLEAVGGVLRQRERTAAVLERDAGVAGDEAAPEALEPRVDERDEVAGPVSFKRSRW